MPDPVSRNCRRPEAPAPSLFEHGQARQWVAGRIATRAPAGFPRPRPGVQPATAPAVGPAEQGAARPGPPRWSAVLRACGDVQGASTEAMLALADFGACVHHGRIRFADAARDQRFAYGLQEVDRTKVPVTLLIPAQDGREWRLRVLPWTTIGGGPQPSPGTLLVVFHQPGEPAPCRTGRIDGAGSLTRAETQVLELLAQGLAAKEIAACRGVSTHTVRAQIAAILEKTCARSQRELLARLGSA